MLYSYHRGTVITPVDGNKIRISNTENGSEVELSGESRPFVEAITYAPQAVGDIVSHLLTVYINAPEDILLKDTEEFLNELITAGIVEETEEYRLKELQINLTERCNEHCIHCYIPIERRRHGSTLSVDECKAVIDDFVVLGGKQLSLSGGEALLFKGLTEVIEYACAKDLKVTLLTNLTLLDERLLAFVAEHGVSEVQVSLYSVLPEEHDRITGTKGACVKTMDAIRKLRERGVRVRISCPVMKANLKHFIRVLNFAEEVGATVQCNCILTMDMDFGRKNEHNVLSKEETEWFCRTMLQYHKDKKHDDFSLSERNLRQEQIQYPAWHAEQHPCIAEINSCCINGNGDVCPCPSWEKPFGNIKKERLPQIWQHSDKLKLLRKITNKSLGPCADCKYIDYCAACPATKYNENAGQIDKTSEYMCQMAQIAYNVEQEFKKQQC